MVIFPIFQVYVLRDKSLLKFTFDRSPRDVQKIVRDVEKAVAAALDASAVNIYDTQFLTKQDGSLDFSSTRFLTFTYSTGIH